MVSAFPEGVDAEHSRIQLISYMTAPPIHPGFMALHSHRAENLLDTVVAWLQAHPLGPLEEEVFIVQSNAVAEWLKMALASGLGVCAATRVELPARFFWRTSRQVLGRAAVPVESLLDKVPLTWRLMQTLPALLADPEQAAVYAPVAGFVQGQGPGAPALRLLQLCQRLADLFDQYQVYRPDWLQAWERGEACLLAGDGRQVPLPAGQAWQAALWQRLMADLSPAQRDATRPALHQRVIQRLEEVVASTADEPGVAMPLPGLPRRVVAFGMSHLPQGLLEMLAALSAHTQVLLAVPNPCQYHWADVIDGRELLRLPHRRHAYKAGVDLSALPLADMHAHAHPLLAAWGRQSRDFVRLLDAFDASAQARSQPDWPRLDLFHDPARPGEAGADIVAGQAKGAAAPPTLLQQLQLNIRDLVPQATQAALRGEPGHQWLAGDRSIVFHVAHSAVRELEVLHDQLLALLAAPTESPLRPRDVVVMVPDIATVAPAIQAVFGQYPRGDARHIPFDIADMGPQSLSPLMTAWHWLWTLPHQRVTYSEWLALLEVPAVQARFGLAADDLPRLSAWMSGAGLRWGLHTAHRQHLGLADCGAQNTAAFALRRMLSGYLLGESTGLPVDHTADPSQMADDTPTPYAEVGGLDAALAGVLAHVLDALDAWWAEATVPATPAQWVARGRALADALFASTGPGTSRAREADAQALAALAQAGQRWLEACDQAGFDGVVTLDVARTAWDHALVAPGVDTRFQAGGVTFCTLMPMRAIPFRVVCLLGMNDADYPRRASLSDFDLLAAPGMQRPGDRARRDDDRQLMLEALMSARDVLYISWAGRSVRDNTEQPPSVLVSQLRDHLAAGWGQPVLQALTTEHPLQPFSRRYFEAPCGADARAATDPHAETAVPGGADLAQRAPVLFTHAHEWRDMHVRSQEHLLQSGQAQGGFLVDGVGDLQKAEHSAVNEQALDAFLIDEKGVPPFVPDPAVPLTLRGLTDMLRHPVRTFFRRRLGVDFGRDEDITPDEEPFGVDGLATYSLLRDALDAVPPGASLTDALAAAHAHLHHAHRSGELPVGAGGEVALAELAEPLTLQLTAWHHVQQAHPTPAERLRVDLCMAVPTDALPVDGLSARSPDHMPGVEVLLHDWLDGLWLSSSDQATGHRVWLVREVSNVVSKPPTRAKPAELRPDKMLGVWLRCLVLSAVDSHHTAALPGGSASDPVSGTFSGSGGAGAPPPHAIVVARDATVTITPQPADEARATLDTLVAVWLQGMQAPLPLPPRTACKSLTDSEDGHAARECYEGGYQVAGEGQDPFWARLYPDFEALLEEGDRAVAGASAAGHAAPGFSALAQVVYAPMLHWLRQCTRTEMHATPAAPEAGADA